MQNDHISFFRRTEFYMLSFLHIPCVTPISKLYHFSSMSSCRSENSRLLWAEAFPETAAEWMCLKEQTPSSCLYIQCFSFQIAVTWHGSCLWQSPITGIAGLFPCATCSRIKLPVTQYTGLSLMWCVTSATCAT